MENIKKIMITDLTITEIKDAARHQFNYELDLNRFKPEEMQIYLILHGLERILVKNGISPGFEMAKLPNYDWLPIDESGLEPEDDEQN